MKLRFAPRAVQDLADIAAYVRKHNPEAALRVRAAILESLQNLVLFSHIGRQQTVESVRKLVTRRYPYLVLLPDRRRGRRNRHPRHPASCPRA